MRKLKLQMQITLDGFVARPNGKLDWMKGSVQDKNFWAHLGKLADSSDTLLLGRKMTDEFMNYWTSVKPDSPEYALAQKMVNLPKIVFSKTLTEAPWINTTIQHDLVPDVKTLKQQDGKDILVYGGAEFVTALIKENLIDEYNFFVNTVAIGEGKTIFGDMDENFALQLIGSRAFDCGIVTHCYQPQNKTE